MLTSFTFQSGYIQIHPHHLHPFSLYIPIWLYSNSANSCPYCCTNSLYIPIWLYSNIYYQFTTYQTTILYIPIWLYSNSGRSTVYTHQYSLYIPIWLYSNIAAACAVCKFVIFTFQSGYIQIVSDLYRTSVFFTFTFQSGYIQM